MKHLYLIITILFIATPLCHAMESQPHPIAEPKIIVSITSSANIESIACVPKNIIAILDKKECRLCDFLENKTKTLKTFTKPIQSGALIPHPTNKQLLALYYEKKISDYTIEIYDIEKKKKIWKKTSLRWFKPVFCSEINTILIQERNNSLSHTTSSGNYSIVSYNYKKNSHQEYPIGAFSYYTQAHPTKKECAILRRPPHRPDKISILELKKDTAPKTIFTNESIANYTYNNTGSLLAINVAHDKCAIFNSESLTHKWLIGPFNKKILRMVFYPASSILATISNDCDNEFLCYWNAKTLQLINIISLTSLLHTNSKWFQCTFAFTLDEKAIVVSLYNKCFVIEIPFEVLSDELYCHGTKNKCLFALWALNNLYDQENMLPQDIRYLVISNILAASQF